MTTTLISFFKLFNPVWLTGPLLEKELRVSSRRRRNYFLRCIYIALLSLFILSTWYSTIAIRGSGSNVYQISRLSQAGRNIITGIAWFQFVAAQLIAMVMLSSSVSDEIRSGTLSVLMTTPINSFQIVAGKLLSKLLQLMLLLAISLPLLAIIRVFGGVPWDYVVASFCITLTAALLAGSLSLILSMTYRYAYTVILVAISVYLLVFGVLPVLFNLVAAKGILNQQVVHSIIALTNPFWAFAATNAMLLIQSGVPKFFSWPIHCLIMLAVTTVFITISVWRVRKVALCEAFGRKVKLGPGRALTRKRSCKIDNTGSQSPAGSTVESSREIKHVTGQPIVWKETQKGFVGRGKGNIAIYVLLIGTFIITVALLFLSSQRNFILSFSFVSGFSLIVMIRLAVLSAGSIVAEKEARTWPVLLATPLEDKEIVWGKAIAAFRRNIPLFLLYLLLLCVQYIRIYSFGFGNLGGIDRLLQILIYLVLTIVSIVCSLLFVIGSGLYFGVRLKTTTAAVAATVGLYLAMTYLLCGMFNPLRFLLYRIVRQGGPWSYHAMTFIFMLIQAGIGLYLVQRAIRRLRGDIF
jgi:ABC-2 type transport system permease protein